MTQFSEEKAVKFLEENGIKNCQIKKVTGDASFRSYYRVSLAHESKILMFAPPGLEDVEPFIKIDDFLIEQGFSAPKILARDSELGFLLLEDFGDNTYSRVLANNDSSEELNLYKKACDCLLEIHDLKKSPKNIPTYNHDLLLREVMLFIDWYLPLKNKSITREEKAEFKRSWLQLFDNLGQFASLLDHKKQNEKQILVLRDYHADNLMILPERESHLQVGLLDFQDAVIGPAAYDLVSLLEDARRDLDERNREKLFEYYLEKAKCNKVAFKADYEILSLQRNIKIIGIFARLSVRDNKDHYLDLLPRVLNFIKMRLESESVILSDISKLIKKFI